MRLDRWLGFASARLKNTMTCHQIVDPFSVLTPFA